MKFYNGTYMFFLAYVNVRWDGSINWNVKYHNIWFNVSFYIYALWHLMFFSLFFSKCLHSSAHVYNVNVRSKNFSLLFPHHFILFQNLKCYHLSHGLLDVDATQMCQRKKKPFPNHSWVCLTSIKLFSFYFCRFYAQQVKSIFGLKGGGKSNPFSKKDPEILKKKLRKS